MLKYIILPIIFILLYMADLWNSISAVSLPALPAHEELLLVPLDSRPVCSTMVQKLGKLAGINVIVPPKELLDNYQEPAKSKKLWQWLQNKSANYNTSIISQISCSTAAFYKHANTLPAHKNRTIFLVN